MGKILIALFIMFAIICIGFSILIAWIGHHYTDEAAQIVVFLQSGQFKNVADLTSEMIKLILSN